MLTSRFLKLALVFVFNITIAIGFYVDNLNVTYSALSSDLLNIIPIANKFDNPDLYKNDLYVNDIENVKYYTPFFVQPLRFIAKFTNNNYIQALNVMSVICHISFGLLWFLLFYKYSSNFWVAFLMSIIVRGVIWLPGLELLGISGLWSIMPRTLYLAFFPIPFLIISNKWKNILLSTFLIGLVFNFHPITGLGGILLFILFLLFFRGETNVSIKKIGCVFVVLILGMLPFILTYFGKTTTTISYNVDDYMKAFNLRIPDLFSKPALFIKLWYTRGTIFFFLPILIYLYVSKNNDDFKNAKNLTFITILLFILPLSSIYIEPIINKIFDLNLRISFQLIRTQKMALIPAYFGLASLLVLISKRLKRNVIPIVTLIFIALLIVSKSSLIRNLPLLGSDTITSILPFKFSITNLSKKNNEEKDAMAKFIEQHTDIDAIIFGDYLYRSASKRSVILDTKGASMLIEGNPKRLIEWYKSKMKFRSYKTIEEKFNYLRSLGVDYYVTKNKSYNLQIVHTEKDWLLYKL